MAKQMFLNLPVQNLDKTVEFFTALGFSFNPDFTDENATCMIVNDDAFVMLLVEGYFQTFTSKPVADASSTAEAIMAFSVESREAVDEMVRTALTSGGTPSEEAQDYGFMYTHSFQDPDGHLWEVFWMDPAGPPKDAAL
ncbi:putative lactoylglutathione lyase [Arthrobacter sp. V4I6]|uniref:VOC family protein n=1 Tax=unclassified Arthrobacter TaxID=235627 RepID=UPI00277FF364|nr:MULTISPECIES: VOC family protein [unclassified Arthrobacter]MDQ0821743.1 putative lactoylglutathione lyase [Arthrobacter sp. V1I7]MDQ0856007.1 putative lactoylglutathione lyase [Arthrobacter sp. V4I6]